MTVVFIEKEKMSYNKTIDKFKPGDTVKCASGLYEIKHFNFGVRGKKRCIINATCINKETGKETIITASEATNRNFTFYKD